MGFFSSSTPAPEPPDPKQQRGSRPRLFGKDPSKEIAAIDWSENYTPEFAMNIGINDYQPAGKCIDCGGLGSFGFASFGRAGRAPCRRCSGTGDEPS
jgi:hypothetical protein